MAKRKRKKKGMAMQVFWLFIKLQILLMLAVLGGLAYYYGGGYAEQVQALKKEAVELIANSDESLFHPDMSSEIFDSDGNLIRELTSGNKSNYVEYEDIPATFITTIISIEDKKYYSHDGVDYKAILRAVKAMLENGEPTQGGSTITMQLVKLMYLDNSPTWQRKMCQIFCALELEKRYSKNKIMEFYLNNIYFANGYYGISAACQGYFGCSLAELDYSQVAFLCSIPNGPSYYDPLAHFDNTIERRNLILKNLYDDGKIDLATYEASISETITLNYVKNSIDWSRNYVATYSYHCATEALMETKGFVFQNTFANEEEEKAYTDSYEELYESCQKELYTKGYRIYTTIDWEKQKALQQAVDNCLVDFTEQNEEGIYKMQSSAVCIDNETGYVLAIVGGRSQDLAMYTLNRAYQSFRQSGSAIKPILDYAPALERGYTPDTIVVDEEIENGPKNAWEGYSGEITLRYALEQSYNTIAWKLLEEIGVDTGLEYLKNMNFKGLCEEDRVLAISIGGFTRGVSSLEMASAYATLENDGKYRNPTCIKCIKDPNGNVLFSSKQEEKIIYKEAAARVMTDMLESVMTNGLGMDMQLTNMPSAGKTGTTNDNKDGWFCGYTRYYTTAVWVGYDLPQAIEGLGGGTYPGQIWQTYMNQIHEGLQPLEFLPQKTLSEGFGQNGEIPIEAEGAETPEEPVAETSEEAVVEPQEEIPEATAEETPEATLAEP